MKRTSHYLAISTLSLSQALLAGSVQAEAHVEGLETPSIYEQQVEPTSKSPEKTSYWGLGIGTVFGALTAGPLGAVVGASLGSALGWGQEQSVELDHQKRTNAGIQEQLAFSQQSLTESQSSLAKTRRTIAQLEKTRDIQSARLAKLEHSRANTVGLEQAQGPDLETVQKIVGDYVNHYINEIYFHHGQSRVPDYAEQRLSKLAELLKAYPELRVTLTAHTDQTGAQALNETLSESRAISVKTILIDQGVAEHRVQIQSHGEDHATVEMGDVPNYVLDRRVAIELSMSDESLSVASVQENAR